MNEQNQNWGFSKVWNEALLDREERPVVARDRIWASELGKAPIDIWLKMKGEKMTNPPNARSLRKFEAGNIWEWIVNLILTRAGILQDAQKWVPYQFPNLLQVTGKLDYKAGGLPDYEKAKNSLEDLMLPEVFLRAGRKIIAYLQQNFPDGLGSKILEIKSTSAFMFDNYEKNSKSSKNHRMQLYHYLLAENMTHGSIVYVCRDDCRMLEIPVLRPSAVEDEYRKAVEEITYYYKKNEQPPLAPLIIFDEDIGKFAKNWNVEYSSYLTKLYGFKEPKDYVDMFKPVVSRFNRVIGRMKEKKEMTKNNLEAIEEMKLQGFDPEALVSKFVGNGDSEEEELLDK